jgi:23S rRNA pseudouridine1911/1915/1917 synthase
LVSFGDSSPSGRKIPNPKAPFRGEERDQVDSTQIEVSEDSGGQRLDRYLADRLGVSRARVRHLLDVGRVRLGDRVLGLADKSRASAVGDVYHVEGALEAADERPEARPDFGLVVAGEGAGWLVVDKPAGCGVHPLRPDQTDTVLNGVIARHPGIFGVGEGGLRSGVVHRLDVDTTGAVIFATDETTWKRLRGAFSEHRVFKTYWALVSGRFEQRQLVDVELAVKRHQPAHVEVVESGGRRCRQTVAPEKILAAATLVEVRLETGFLHQIRATMAHLGHPILGDVEYGGPATIATGSGEIAVARPMLHASRLSVDEIDVKIDLPDDFRSLLDALA